MRGRCLIGKRKCSWEVGLLDVVEDVRRKLDCIISHYTTRISRLRRCDSSSQMRKFFEATSSREAQVLSKGRILNACCAKVICVEESPSETMPDCPMIEISVPDTSSPMPAFHWSIQQQIVDEFQPKLLMFRLRNYGLVRDSAFDLPKLPAQVRDIARCLGAGVEGDAELQGKLALLLKEQGLQICASGENPICSAIIEGLLAVSHQLEKKSAGVAEITKVANDILARRGELLELQPRAVGSLLRTLGFSTQRLGAAGRGITLLNSIRDRIHDLAVGHKLFPRGSRSASCAQCEELILRQDFPHDEEESIRTLESMSNEELDSIA
jgi:hypothetical protein